MVWAQAAAVSPRAIQSVRRTERRIMRRDRVLRPTPRLKPSTFWTRADGSAVLQTLALTSGGLDGQRTRAAQEQQQAQAQREGEEGQEEGKGRQVRPASGASRLARGPRAG